jgi:hypothetical protein
LEASIEEETYFEVWNYKISKGRLILYNLSDTTNTNAYYKEEAMILSFGEIPQEHEIVNIAYAFAQQKQKTWFNGELPIDPVMRAVSMLEQQAEQLKADGVKNITIKISEGTDTDGDKVVNVWGMGTIVKLK